VNGGHRLNACLRLVGALFFILEEVTMDKKNKPKRLKDKKIPTNELRYLMGEFRQKLVRHKGAYRRR
jgi:hypothetical protein